MQQIILKLSVTGEERMYLINNVSVGIGWALNHEKVKENKYAFSKLQELEKQVLELKHPYRYADINYTDLSIAFRISQDALNIINDIY